MQFPYGLPILEPAKRAFRHIYRRFLSPGPTSQTPEDNVAWEQRQFRYHPVPLPFTSPLSLARGNLTGETTEMRISYREWGFREPAAKASLLTKCLGVAQLDPQWKSSSKKQQDKDVSNWCDWSITNSGGGWGGLIMNTLLPATLDGFSLQEKVNGHVEQFGSEYHRRWTITEYASIDTELTRFILDQYREIVGVQSIAGTQTAYQLDPRDFVIFTHLKVFENPFGISDMRAAVRACRLIEAAIRLRQLLLTNFSGPFLVAKAGGKGTSQSLMNKLQEARASGYIVIPQGSEIEVMNLATANIDTFRSTIEDYRQEIVQAIQGAYLQLLEGGITNGRGNTQVHASIAQLYQWWLAEQVSQVINKQIIPDLVTPTYGYTSGLPRVSLGGIDEDAIGKALDRFKKGQDLGIKMSESQVREVGGFEQPADATDVLVPPQQGQQGGGQDPFGGLFPPTGGTPQDGGDSGGGSGNTGGQFAALPGRAREGAAGSPVDTFRY